MPRANIKRCLVGVLLGMSICFLSANQAAISPQAQTAGISEVAASTLRWPLPELSQGNTAQGKNPYVAELEKKIVGQENKPAEEVYKNIRLFKGMPAGRILRIMEVAFNPALGVDCTHCHTPGEWEKDDKEPKQIARKMWGFQGQINQQLKELIGKGAVNCTTCHRGQVKPALNLPPPK